MDALPWWLRKLATSSAKQGFRIRTCSRPGAQRPSLLGPRKAATFQPPEQSVWPWPAEEGHD